ncbi:hypothetical protein E2542_SST20129 [Spatholobus suberectus]|nr:hypothetical protein E2542_SST20129 [Spatholobus suberectus]
MVDVDRRPPGPNPAHLAGLRRLSARAASVSAPTLQPSDAEFALSESRSDPPILKRQRSVAEKHSARCPVPNFSRRSLDSAVDRRRREAPKWVEGYVGLMGSVLREGGWSEADISEMVSGSGSDVDLLDNEAVMDALVLKAEGFSDSLRKSGWSSEEVSDALGLRLPEKGRRPPKKVSPQLVERIGKLVESEDGEEREDPRDWVGRWGMRNEAEMKNFLATRVLESTLTKEQDQLEGSTKKMKSDEGVLHGNGGHLGDHEAQSPEDITMGEVAMVQQPSGELFETTTGYNDK